MKWMQFTFTDSSGTHCKRVYLCFLCVGASVIEFLATAVTESQLEVHQTDRKDNTVKEKQNKNTLSFAQTYSRGSTGEGYNFLNCFTLTTMIYFAISLEEAH